MDDLDRLARRLGYQFKDPALLQLALSHRSVSRRRNNERLEFLGDAVLQLASSDYLFHHFPEHQEGQLTLLRASLIFVALTLCLGAGLLLVNNLDSLHASRAAAGDASDAAVFVTLVSASNSAGRLLAGYGSDAALYRHGVPRPLALTAACVVLALGMLLLTLPGLPPLYAACTLGGAAFGALNMCATRPPPAAWTTRPRRPCATRC